MSILSKIAVGVLRCYLFVYDVITTAFYAIFQCPCKERGQNRPWAEIVSSSGEKTSWKRYGRPPDHFSTQCRTYPEMFAESVKRYGDRPLFGVRKIYSKEEEKANSPSEHPVVKYTLGAYEWITYSGAAEIVDDLVIGFLRLGVRSKQVVLVYSETRMEWMLSTLALLKMGATVATLVPVPREEPVIFTLNQTEAKCIVTSEHLFEKVDIVAKNITIVHFESQTEKAAKRSQNNNRVLSFAAVQAMGRVNNEPQPPFEPPSNEDIALIMYTSGSTGDPKGVLISHRNCLAATYSLYSMLYVLDIQVETFIGYLPLSHILEFVAESTILSVGGRTGYSSKDTLLTASPGIKKGAEGDMVLLKPTIMAGVPLIYDRLKKGIFKKVEAKGPVLGAVFKSLISYKTWWVRRGFGTPIIDMLFLSKIKSSLGGKLKIIISGGAALDPSSQEFIYVCFNSPIMQCYGLTETTALGTGQTLDFQNYGRVGSPFPGITLSLVNWPEGGYAVTDEPDPRGEIVFSGENITQGYFKKAKETQEAYSTDTSGQKCFLTGDIGRVAPDGTLEIIDRKKDLVKLLNGKYISLGHIESVLKTSPIVDNICICTDKTKDFVVALVVSNREELLNFSAPGQRSAGFESLCDESRVKDKVKEELTKLGLARGLARIEVPVAVRLVHEVWTPDNELATASLKLKRVKVNQKYQQEIKDLFEEGEGLQKNKKESEAV